MAELGQEGAGSGPTVASGQDSSDKLSEPQRATDQVHPPHLAPESWPYTQSNGLVGNVVQPCSEPTPLSRKPCLLARSPPVLP